MSSEASRGLVGVILASGRGQRIGGPKALLAWRRGGREMPLAVAHAQAMREAGAERVLLVTRADIAARLRDVEPGLEDGVVRCVLSSAPDEQGAAGSLAAAASHLSSRGVVPDTLWITPVDCLPAAKALLDRLLLPMRAGSLAARPRLAGRGGHPVLIAGALLEAYGQPDPPSLRTLLRGLDEGCADVTVDDAAVLVDLDRPSDWSQHAPQGLRSEAPRFLG